MRIILLACFSCLSVILFSQQFNPEIDKAEIEQYIRVLASDSMEGRGSGSKGGEMAACYIRDRFSEAGLELIFDKGLQSFSVVTGINLGSNNKLSVGDSVFKIEKDFIPLGFSGNGNHSAEVFFAGYGFSIDEDTIQWDDYSGIDVKDKWVLIFRADPDLDNPVSIFARYSQDRYKVMNAIDHGAAGVLLVNPVDFEKEDVLSNLRPVQNATNVAIPVLHITRQLANKILSVNGKTCEGLEQTIIKAANKQSFLINTRVTGSSDLITVKANTYNIAAKLMGSKPSDKFIVVGAHFDHLGFGGKNSRMPDTIAVHYGADDNASGVAAIIELAQKFAKTKPELNLLFVAFGAEEMGLLGSTYMLKNMSFPKENIKAMINLDMVGRLDSLKSLSISGIGTAMEFDSILSIVYSDKSFTITKNPDGSGPSDHAAFYSEGIPVLFFTSGLHEEYHTPLDNAELINFSGEMDITESIVDLIYIIASESSPLTFQLSGAKEAPDMRRRLKVTLGIMPDFASNVKGLGVSGVRPDGPADKGGIQKGDVIIAIDGKPVTDIYDYMYRLAKFSHGQRITVEVKRGEENILIVIDL